MEELEQRVPKDPKPLLWLFQGRAVGRRAPKNPKPLLRFFWGCTMGRQALSLRSGCHHLTWGPQF